MCSVCDREATKVSASGHPFCGAHAFREAIRGMVALLALDDRDADRSAVRVAGEVRRLA